MQGGRRSGIAAVLFTDLVGSTDLLSRLGETAFDELRRQHFSVLRQVVERAGGDEIKTLGDGVLAVFGSAAEAVSAAVAAQQATERHGRDAGVPLSLRAGLAVGDVAFEEGDVFGTPVVEAARLVTEARPGQILTTAVVRMVAGGRTDAAFSDAGVVELKGLPGPVAICQVAWEPLTPATTAIPLPSLLAGGRGRIFVGRDEELERLRHLWKEVAAGDRRVVLLAGEPGVGKTRLAAQLAGAVHTEGAIVLAGRCDEDLGVPYQPFVEALRHFLTHTPEPPLGRHAGELARLVPELPELVPGLPEPVHSDPETERYRLFDAVATWLSDLAADTPTLLVLDDLHWAAKPTLLLLRHVLRGSDPLKLLILATYRDTELGRGHPLQELLADLRRGEAIERLPLIGLDVPGIAALLEQVAGHELGEGGHDMARAVWRETEGNAFFVVEVLRHLIESGAFERQEGRWVTTAAPEALGIPEGVRDVVGRRLSRLSEDANRVLALASVVGPEFEVAVVEAAGDLPQDTVLAGLDEAVAARLVLEVEGPVPRNRFAHNLVRETLYHEITAARRGALHRRVAEAIEVVHAHRLDDQAAALAHHWARASTPSTEASKAVDWAKRAGDRALGQLAHDEAVDWYRQAVELLDGGGTPAHDRRRIGLLVDLGEAQRRAGDRGHRETLLSAAGLAQAAGDADLLVRATLANSRGVWTSSWLTDHERISVLEAAIQAAGTNRPAPQARLLASLGTELLWEEGERPLRMTGEALELARQVGDPSTLGHVLLARCAVIGGDPVLLAEAEAVTGELSALARTLRDPFLGAWANYFRSWTAVLGGVPDDAHQALEEAVGAAGDSGQPMLRWIALLSQAGLLQLAGRLADAEILGREARSVGIASGQPDAGRFFGALRFFLRYDQGRLFEVIDGVEQSLAEAELPGVRPMLALAYCELGREPEARRVFAPLTARLSSRQPVTVDPLSPRAPDRHWTMAAAAKVCAALDDAEAAQLVHGVLNPLSIAIAGTPIAWVGSVAHLLGLLTTTLGRFDEAEPHFREAAEIEARFGAAVLLARTRLEWARMLLRRGLPGDAERASGLLDQAVTTARELGAAGIERSALALA